MRRVAFMLALLTISAVALPAQQGGSGRASLQRESAVDTAALRAEVESLHRAMEAAVNRGDLLGAAAFYADDAVVRAPGGVVARGRAELDRYFTSIGDPKSWKLDLFEVGGTRDVVYDIGRSTLVHGNPERTSVVDFVVVWRRQTDGKLRIILDYYHSTPQRRP